MSSLAFAEASLTDPNSAHSTPLASPPAGTIEPVSLSERNPLLAPPSLFAAKPLIDPHALIEARKADDVRHLFALEQLEVAWDAELGTLWTFMRPHGRPSYNLALLEDFHAWQRGILAMFAERARSGQLPCLDRPGRRGQEGSTAQAGETGHQPGLATRGPRSAGRQSQS